MNNDKRTGWRAKLKEGDKVVVRGYGLSIDKEVREILRITPTGRIVIKGSNNLYYETFNQYGYGNSGSLEEATPDLIEGIETKNKTEDLKCKIRNVTEMFCHIDVTLTELEVVWGILKKYKDKAKNA